MINGFTKEELKDILVWAEAYTEFGQSWITKLHEPLLNKIQSLIDSYCDHKWENGCCGCDPENIVCEKCHIDLWGTKHE